MKKIFFVLSAACLLVSSCQKSISPGNILNTPGADTTITSADSLTYEVVTNDPGGWVTNKNYFSYHDNPLALLFAYPSGWKFTFRPSVIPFNMGMQASSFSNSSKSTINFYVNSELVKTGVTYELDHNYYEMHYELH